MTLKVAIIGRPNVGKSTIFNRFITSKKDQAIVNPTPGVTRDRREADAQIYDINFTLIDTAGLENTNMTAVERKMFAQTLSALDDCHAIFFVFDGKLGVTPVDEHFAQFVKKRNLPTLLIANKCEAKINIDECYKFGLGDPVCISAEHALGIGDLHEVFKDLIEKYGLEHHLEEEDDEKILKIAIVGRPNVGKSTLINGLVGSNRVITGPEAGITRDSIAIEWSYEGHHIKLYDTAGIRKKAKVFEAIEKLSVDDSLKAVQYAQIVALMVDGQTLFERQDLVLSRRITDEGRAMIVIVNKWDLVKNKEAVKKEIFHQLQESVPQCRDVPVVYVSALKEKNLNEIMPNIMRVYEQWNTRLSTGKLNRWLEKTIDRYPPPISKGRRVKIRYMTQVKARPPRFALFTSQPTALPESYVRYLTNALKEEFQLSDIVIRLFFRKGKNPYDSNE